MHHRAFLRIVGCTLLWVAFGLGCDDSGGDPEVDVGRADAEPDMRVRPDATMNCVPRPEVCNGLDDDCDGLVDADDDDLRLRLFDDVENCGACGTVCGAPRAEFVCQAAVCVIIGCDPGWGDYNADPTDGCEADCVLTAGGREACDTVDNDCDGLTDEGFELDTDLENCGGCGVVCAAPPNAGVLCVAGDCVLEGCRPGWVNLDGDDADGCEYACQVRSTEQVTEYCNGLDDDCDGRVDEAPDLVPPPDTCGDQGECARACAADADCAGNDVCGDGVCVQPEVVAAPCEEDADCQAAHPGLACVAASTLVEGAVETERQCRARPHGQVCDGADGWRCARAPTWQFGHERGRCDGLDNDCDGRVDEDFVAQLLADDRETPRPCRVGFGVCLQAGVVECTPDGVATQCSVTPLPPPAPVDDQCDGFDDDCDGVLDEDFPDAWVALPGFEIFAFEASRPGATAAAPGFDPRPDDAVATLLEDRTCSKPGVLPWADVDWATAGAACASIGARLCTADEWSQACGGADASAFPYGPAYRADACNGGDFDVDPAPGIQDAVRVAGSLATCGRAGVLDLSGNLKEWTDDRRDGLVAVRGGGYETNLEAGLRCDQLFDLKAAAFHHDSIGFRCCR